MSWQLQEAKQKFSRLVQQAVNVGPQVVTKYGEAVVVVVSADEYRRLTGDKMDFKDFLMSSPDLDEVIPPRTQEWPREIQL